MRVGDFAAFIKAREAVRQAKEGGKPLPWTDDPILKTYRFCNVRREDDAVTRELKKAAPTYGPDQWFWWVAARLFNNPDTMRALGDTVVPFMPRRMAKILERLKAQDRKIFNGAYIVSTNGRPGSKVDYLLDQVLAPMWRPPARRAMNDAIHDGGKLWMVHSELMRYQGMGSFMAAQIVADVKYTPALRAAQDWHTWAASGPGSRRGLNRVMGRPWTGRWDESEWHACLAILRRETLKLLPPKLRDLHAQDIQNCLCEFDKYERIRLGEGRPKQLYPGWE